MIDYFGTKGAMKSLLERARREGCHYDLCGEMCVDIGQYSDALCLLFYLLLLKGKPGVELV
jgi:hypothetical protein